MWSDERPFRHDEEPFLVEERGCPHPQHFRQTQRRGKVPVAPDSPRAAAGDSRAPNEFTNEDVYAFARELEKLHPDNSESFRERASM